METESSRTSHYPIRDSMGNIVMITDQRDARSSATTTRPSGSKRSASTPRRHESIPVIVIEGVVEVLFSEAIDIKAIQRGVQEGRVTLTSASASLPVEARKGLGLGRNEGRRILLAPHDPVAPGTTVGWTRAETVLDLFQKAMAGAYERTFEWAEDRVVEDTTRPQLLEIRVRDAEEAEIEFTEPIDTAQAAAAISVDGEHPAWSQSSDGYTLFSGTALPTGPHRIQIPATLADPPATPSPNPSTRPSPSTTRTSSLTGRPIPRSRPAEPPVTPTASKPATATPPQAGSPSATAGTTPSWGAS